MAAANLKQVVCSTEETERDPGGLAQILMMVLHTFESVGIVGITAQKKFSISFEI